MQKLIKLEVTKHERRITTEIKNDKSHRKLWDTVNTLRGKLRNENKENTLYDLDNKIIENSEYADVINECWPGFFYELKWTFLKLRKVALFYHEKRHVQNA